MDMLEEPAKRRVRRKLKANETMKWEMKTFSQ